MAELEDALIRREEIPSPFEVRRAVNSANIESERVKKETFKSVSAAPRPLWEQSRKMEAVTDTDLEEAKMQAADSTVVQ
jgi:hypothetical protein